MKEEILPINLEFFARFGVGKDSNSLYFDDERVHTDSVFHLTKKQNIIAIIVAVVTVPAAVSTLIYNIFYILFSLHIVGEVNETANVKLVEPVHVEQAIAPLVMSPVIISLQYPDFKVVQHTPKAKKPTPKRAHKRTQ